MNKNISQGEMTMRKRWNKLLSGIVAVGLAVSMMAVTAYAFDEDYDYSIGPNSTGSITSFVTGCSTIYLNTRPDSGGSVTIKLSGAKTASSTFPYQTNRPDWEVNNVNPSTTLYVKGTAGNGGSAGTLHIWS